MEFHRYPIGPVLEHYGFDPVAPDRAWHAIRCEFHGDRDASGSVNTVTQVYNCFAGLGCPTGSAVQIVMKKEGLTYSDALFRTEEITGDSDSSVRQGYRGRSSVSRSEGHYRSYREIRESWLRQESDSGSWSSDG